jgi:hypothetical protein
MLLYTGGSSPCCATDIFEGVGKPTDPFSEKKCIKCAEERVVRFIEVSKHFWSPEAVNRFVAYII